jgi:hypothetical protein
MGRGASPRQQDADRAAAQNNQGPRRAGLELCGMLVSEKKRPPRPRFVGFT